MAVTYFKMDQYKLILVTRTCILDWD